MTPAHFGLQRMLNSILEPKTRKKKSNIPLHIDPIWPKPSPKECTPNTWGLLTTCYRCYYVTNQQWSQKMCHTRGFVIIHNTLVAAGVFLRELLVGKQADKCPHHWSKKPQLRDRAFVGMWSSLACSPFQSKRLGCGGQSQSGAASSYSWASLRVNL